MITAGLNHAYVWKGSNSNDIEWTKAKQMVNILGMGVVKEISEIIEGNESQDFWNTLGGKDNYEKIKVNLDALNSFDARLFEVSNKSGYTTMKEVPSF